MNIKHLSKPKVLAALFNAARPQGMSYLAYKPGHIMTEEEAAEILQKKTYFDYLEGKVLKVSLAGDDLCTDLYDRDNGHNAALNAINTII